MRPKIKQMCQEEQMHANDERDALRAKVDILERRADKALAEAASLARRLVEEQERRWALERRVELLSGGRPIKGGAALFRRRPQYDETIGRVSESPSTFCGIVVEFARPGIDACVRGFINDETLARLPQGVRAESWWHLCATLGIKEWMARLLFIHPEEGQESAVASARTMPPKRALRRTEAVLYCQGEED